MTGSGVLLTIKSKIQVEKLNVMPFDINFPPIDVIGCKCYISFNIVYGFVTYISSTTNVVTFKNFFDAFEELDYLHDCNVIILGDFNIPQYLENDVKYSKTFVMLNFLTFLTCNNLIIPLIHLAAY